MKKSHKVFLSILFVFLIAMPFATGFLWQESTIETSVEDTEVSSPILENTNDTKDERTDKESATWTESTYKTYDGYFIDFNITAETIAEQDLTGTGSAADPYIVRSTKGFLWLTNYELSKISLSNKFIKLACDIVLNDETFDENGNPSGGDGIYYSWKPITTGEGAELNGNGYEIKGLYINDSTLSNQGLFGAYLKPYRIANISMTNVFVKASDRARSLAYSTQYLEDCIVKNGYIVGNNEVSGLNTVAQNAFNCINYANVNSTGQRTGGIIASAYGDYFYNLKNYGKITGSAAMIGGVAGASSELTYIENCENYGIIEGKDYHTGGIIGFSSNTYFKNCENYGKLDSTKTALGGIFGYGHSLLEIVNCANYGKVGLKFGAGGGAVGEIVGEVSQRIGELKLQILNCKISSGSGRPVIGSVEYMAGREKENCHIQLKNLEIIQEDNFLPLNCFLIYLFQYYTSLYIENINISCDESHKDIYLLNTNYKTDNLTLKNVYIKMNDSISCRVILFSEVQEGFVVDGVLIEQNIAGVSAKHYYGENFSGYSISWKTGDISLNVFNGMGLYQYKVTENILQGYGFVKKEM